MVDIDEADISGAGREICLGWYEVGLAAELILTTWFDFQSIPPKVLRVQAPLAPLSPYCLQRPTKTLYPKKTCFPSTFYRGAVAL